MVHMLHTNDVNHHHDVLVAFVIEIFLSFVKSQVKLMNFDGTHKSSAIILNF